MFILNENLVMEKHRCVNSVCLYAKSLNNLKSLCNRQSLYNATSTVYQPAGPIKIVLHNCLASIFQKALFTKVDSNFDSSIFKHLNIPTTLKSLKKCRYTLMFWPSCNLLIVKNTRGFNSLLLS